MFKMKNGALKTSLIIIIIFVLTMVSVAAAEEPITEMVVDIRMGAQGASTLPDGTFIFVGDDGTIAEVSPAKAASISPAGTTNWELLDYYDQKSSNRYHSVFALESGTIITANSSSYISSDNVVNNEMILTQIQNGTVVSRRTLADPLNSRLFKTRQGILCFEASRIEQTTAQESVVYPRLTGYDEDLNILWSNDYDSPLGIGKIIPLWDGFCLMGSRATVADAVTSSDYIAKMDDLGNVVWEQTLGSHDLGWYDGVHLEDGSFVVVGGRETGDPMHETVIAKDAVIAKFSDGGDLLWRKDYTINNIEFLSMQIVDQGFLTAGISRRDDDNYIVLSYLDVEGNLLKNWDVEHDMERPTAVSLHQTPNGIYLVAAVRERRAIDANGEAKGPRTYKTLIQKIQ